MKAKKTIRQVKDIADAVNDMNKAMTKTPSALEDKKERITAFQKKYPDVKYIEPYIEIPTQGVRHPEVEKQRQFLTEYVVGVFESQIVSGSLSFFLTGLPGDPYYGWNIPVNKSIGVPRFVAQHLNKNLSWKEMKPIPKSQEPIAYSEEDITKPFENFEEKRRGNFYPINSY